MQEQWIEPPLPVVRQESSDGSQLDVWLAALEMSVASILLIDDDEDLTDFLRGELETRGHTVDCLDCPEHALDHLAQTPFDLVLLDNKMPRITGTEFLEALRRRGV